MKVIRGINNIKKKFKRPIVAVGVFDGVHLGHKKIIRRLVKKAKRVNGTSLVITFDPHPDKVLHPVKYVPLLISLKHRLRLFKELGVDRVLVLKFTKTFSGLRAGDFVKRVLVDKIGAKELLIGKGFVLGKGKSGGRRRLRRLASKYGFKISYIRMHRISNLPISSTRIRRLIIKGRLAQAANLLGRRVGVLGTVKPGAKLGRVLGYPTCNIDPHHEAIPPSGVYAVLARHKNKTYGGVLNIGRRPTFYKRSDPTIEVHIFNFRKSIYNQDLEIEFIKRIRNEKKFPSNAALINQIKLDEKKSRKLLAVFI